MKVKPIILEVGDGIVLRQYAAVDAHAIFALIAKNKEHLNRNEQWISKKYPNEKAVLDSILNPPEIEKLRFGIWDGETFVGSVNLMPKKDFSVTLGYWLGKQYQGNGYVHKSSERLIRYAFCEMRGVEVIYADVLKKNTRSLNVVRKLGFLPFTTFRKRITFFKIRS